VLNEESGGTSNVYRRLWDPRSDELDKIVEELKRKEKGDGHRKSSLEEYSDSSTVPLRGQRSGNVAAAASFQRLSGEGWD
jgi:hypothetical protein